MDALKPVQPPAGLLIIGVVVSLLYLLMAIPKSWEEATKKGGDGSLSLSDSWAKAIEKKKSKYEAHELYMLVAANRGYFYCKHCPSGRFYLRTGEIYRYGTTGEGQHGRGYSQNWLNDHLLSYVVLMKSDIKTVKMAETTLIGNYVLLPENLNRPLMNQAKSKPNWYRLVLPPGNNTLD